MRWAGHVARVSTGGVHIGFWWGKVKGRDHLEEPGIDNIKLDIQEVVWVGMDWIDLA